MSKLRTILIVDDEPLLLGVFVRRLSKQGYKVLYALDGERALELFKEHQSDIDTVILDVNLAGLLTGWDCVRTIQKCEHQPYIICMSGENPAKDSPCPDHFLKKPFRVQELISLLNHLD